MNIIPSFEILKGSIENGSHIIVLVVDQPESGDTIYTESKHALLHHQNVFMTEGQKFITTSAKIVSGSSTSAVDKIILHFGKTINILGQVKITLKSKITKEIYGIKYISNTSIDKVIFDLATCVNHTIPDTDILNNKLQIEIETLCEKIEPCCDKLPSNMTLIPNNIYLCTDCNITPSITTTTSSPDILLPPSFVVFSLSSENCGDIYFPNSNPRLIVYPNVGYILSVPYSIYYDVEVGYYGNSMSNTPSWRYLTSEGYWSPDQSINVCGFTNVSGEGFYKFRVMARGAIANSDYTYSEFMSIFLINN